MKYRWAECHFVGENDLTIDVNMGRYYANDFECGICKNKFESLETCEKFKC